MHLREVIRAVKANVTTGSWSIEKPRKKDFPLSRCGGGAYPLTRKWRWCTIEFEAGGANFRLLVAYHVDLPEFLALLGEQVAGDSRVLARLEFHANHPEVGWHMHVNCEESSTLGVGMVKPLGQLRIPGVHCQHRRGEYTLNGDSMNDNMALGVVCDWFRLPYQPSLAI